MTTGLGPLQTLLDDPEVFEVMVVADGHVWVEDRGGLRRADHLTARQVDDCIEHISRTTGRPIDIMRPVLDGRLTDQVRACVVIPPIAANGTSINLRKFPSRILPLAAFAGDEATDIVRRLVCERRNVVVSGATSSGKTSLLSSVSRLFAPHERVVCVEDTHELRFAHPHVVHLQTRTPNQEGAGEVTMRDLVRTSLRMRPDRLVVGEVRGSEAVDMVLAMSSGHRGCWSSVHATSAHETVPRIAHIIVRDAPQWSRNLAHDMAIAAIDAIVHMARDPRGRRRITEIATLSDGRHHVSWRADHPLATTCS